MFMIKNAKHASVYKPFFFIGQGRGLRTRKISILSGHHNGDDRQKQWNVRHRGQKVLGGRADRKHQQQQ